jgi:hypothetical protein
MTPGRSHARDLKETLHISSVFAPRPDVKEFFQIGQSEVELEPDVEEVELDEVELDAAELDDVSLLELGESEPEDEALLEPDDFDVDERLSVL